MFQDFRRRTTPETGPGRLARLRAAMAEARVDAFLVPRADAHQGEAVPARDERLAWLTGFTGSAGIAAVTAARAAVFVDGRYTLQVAAEVDAEAFEVASLPKETPGDWLAEALAAGNVVGFDPWLHTAGEIETLTEALEPKAIGLARVDNLVDRVWDDQPPPPAGPIVVHPEALAGRSAAEKRAAIGEDVRRARRRRGRADPARFHRLAAQHPRLDIARTPVALAFAILHRDGRVALFTDPAKLDAEVARPPRPRGRGRGPGGLRPGARRARRRRRGRQGERAGLGRRPARRRGPRGDLGPRPLHPAQGDQDRGRARRRARGASARRCRDGRVPRLARPRRRRAAGSPRSPWPSGSRASGAPATACATSPSTRSAAPARTPRSCTTG
jgi:hypothetical protein